MLTTFTIPADMAKNVAGGHLNIVSITKPGADKKFGPSGPVSREAMAAFLHRASTAGLLTGG